MNEVFVLNVRLNALEASSLAEMVSALIRGNDRSSIYKINTEFLIRALRDRDFLGVLNSSTLNISDGRGVLWAAKFLSLPFATKKLLITNNKLLMTMEAVWQMIYSGAAIVFNPKYITYPISENIPGVDALKIMLRAADEANASVFLFGATQNDLEMAINNIQKEMPRLKIVGSLNGYDFQKDSMMDPVSIINETDAKLLVVALGSPLQENWIRNNLGKLSSVRVAVGEGGSLAFPSVCF